MKKRQKPRNHVFLAMRKTRIGGEHQSALKPSRVRLKESLRKEVGERHVIAVGKKDLLQWAHLATHYKRSFFEPSWWNW